MNDKKQIDKFKEAARELETDDREEAFDEKLKKVAGLAALPVQGDVESALWGLLKARPKGITAQEAYDELANVFLLTHEQANRKMPNETRERHWHNRVRQAHRALVDHGFAVGGETNRWTLTALGKLELKLGHLNK